MERDEVAKVITDSVIRARPALISNSIEEILQMNIDNLALDSLDTTTLSLDIEDATQIVVEPEDVSGCETFQELLKLLLEKKSG